MIPRPDPVGRANRSAALLALGDAPAALAAARAARERDASYAKAWYREGAAARALGRWEDAAAAFFEGFRVAPDNADLAAAFQDAVAQGRAAHEKEKNKGEEGKGDC